MNKISTKEFFQVIKKDLNLSTVNKIDDSFFAGKKITKYVARPGLALIGFFEHFDENRIQVLGETEVLYLQTLSGDAKKWEKLENYFKFNIPMIIISKNKRVPQFFINFADKYKVPIYKTDKSTDEIYTKLRKLLEENLAKKLTIDASLISVYNVGILIEGNEGYGKSETTLELIKNGHQFIRDGKVLIKNIGGKLIGEALKDPDTGENTYPLDLKGIGKINIDQIFGVKSILKSKEINLRVIFSKNDEIFDATQSINFKNELRLLLNVRIPMIQINIDTNKSVATIIEMIAINYLTNYVFKK